MLVFLVLAGSGIHSDEKIFIGWFGPRGLASIVFAVMVINEHLPGNDTITSTVVCSILLSIVAILCLLSLNTHSKSNVLLAVSMYLRGRAGLA